MGPTKISATESNVDELIHKTDFPKLKAFESMGRGRKAVEVAGVSKNQIPAFFWFMLALFFSQLILFFVTLYMIHQFQKTNAVAVSSQKESVDYIALSEKRGGAEKVFPEKILPARANSYPTTLILCDFERLGFKTNLGTSIFIHPDKFSQDALKISVASGYGYGKSGKALQIHYQFVKFDKQPAAVNVALPDVDVTGYRKVSFRLRAQSSSGNMPKLEINFIDTGGKSKRVSVSQIFSFWKKYEFDLKPIIGSAQPTQWRMIQLILYPVSTSPEGIWYLDDLVLE